MLCVRLPSLVKAPLAWTKGAACADVRTQEGVVGMLNVFGETMVMEDGTEAPIVPLREDRAALASLALSAFVVVVFVALGF